MITRAPSPIMDEVSNSGGASVLSVDAEDWRAAVQHLLDHDHTFFDLHATEIEGRIELRAALARGAEFRMLTCTPESSPAPTIVDIVPAAAWDEREAAELHGVAFDGHRTRPLVAHVESLDAWTTRVTGRDTHQVAVGPIHAGVIESGHFRFHVVGERILHLDLRLFYKHRGLEEAARGRQLADARAVAQRACAACAVANTVAYAQACEQALGLAATPAVRRARTTLLELERLHGHLNDIAAACAGVGFAPGNMYFAALTERARRLNHLATGHRFLFDAVEVGLSELCVPREIATQIRGELERMRDEIVRAWEDILFTGSVHNRFDGVGVLTRDTATVLGTVGPAARACGIASDHRQASPQLAYEHHRVVTPDQPSGDVRARVEMRACELVTTLDLLDRLLDDPIAPGACEQIDAGAPTGMSAVESPRGRTFCTIERTGSTLNRLRLRTASYANWPALAVAASGELLPEFPLINKSFELCYACCDR